MSEEFDKELRDHIADVFVNYKDSSADTGWALLRQKYPEKDERRPLAWWWLGAAAGILLFSGAAFWIYSGDRVKKVQESKQVAKGKSPGATATDHRGTPFLGSSNAEPDARHIVRSTPAFAVARIKGQHAAVQSVLLKRAPIVSPLVSINGQQHVGVVFSAEQPNVLAGNATARPEPDVDSEKIGAMVTSVQPQAAQKADSAVKSKKPDPLITEKTKPAQTNATGVAWNVFASAYNNFASNSAANANAGAGFGTDISLNRQFTLSTGLGVFHNTTGYDPSAGLLLYAASPAPSTYYSVINYRAELLTLEMPLRLNFIISKKGNYVSAGISSAVFITESYHQTNQYFNSAVFSSGLSSSAQAQTQDAVTEKHFQTFVFAKSLDLAAGFGCPFGKYRIVLEPFVKIPLNSINRPELNYGALGADVKFCFGTGK